MAAKDCAGKSGLTIESERRVHVRPSAVERRCEQRYSAFGSPIVVGWWEGGEFRKQEALLRDVSLSGASATVETAPPSGVSIVVRLSGGQASEWVEAEVVEACTTEWTKRAPSLLRIRFLHSCPYDFFTGAIKGFGMQGCTPAQAFSNSAERPVRIIADFAKTAAVPVTHHRLGKAPWRER